MLHRGYARRLCCCGGYADATAAMPRRRGGYAAAMWRGLVARLCGGSGYPAAGYAMLRLKQVLGR